MNLQVNAPGQTSLLPEVILMEVPMPSPIWIILVQSGWRMIDMKENKALLAREFIKA